MSVLFTKLMPPPLLKTSAPVTFAEFTAEERLCLMHRHRQGPPLHGLQRAVWDAIPEAHKPRLSDPAVFDPRQFDPARDPKRFLDQMVTAFTLLGRRDRATIARTHKLHPDFITRVTAGTSPQADSDLVVLQQRQGLPAYQLKLREMHGTRYIDWLRETGFPMLAEAPHITREREKLINVSTAAPKPQVKHPRIFR